jgi:phosphoserine phosphatase RsbU/P
VAALRPPVDGAMRVSVVCAGHPPPLLFRSEEIGPVGEYGMPLGLSSDAAFTATELTLAPGQGMLLYTDGISERHRTHVDAIEDAELMGVLRDAASASPQRVVNALGDLLVAAGPLHDDAAVLVIAPE